MAEKASEPLYGNIPALPTIETVDGIRFDFNNGYRIFVPDNGKKYHIIVTDQDTGFVSWDHVSQPGTIVTGRVKFFARYHISILSEDDSQTLLDYTYKATDHTILIQFPRGAGLGDTIAWFSCIERFANIHKCKIVIAMEPWMSDIFRNQYKQFKFITRAETDKETPFATYYMGLFFKGNLDYQPIDFRYVSLTAQACNILGIPEKEEYPKLNLSAPRHIKDKYAVIAVQSSAQCKYWNNPNGWHDVIDFLRKNNYRVICIDRDRVYGSGMVQNHIPWGVEDMTGKLPLQERIDILKDADLFIGTSSGLSWLAWACHVPVVLISGFTNPLTEFKTPYRAINYHVCNSCWNDIRCEFDHSNLMWCPRHQDDDKQFICSRSIPSKQVISLIERTPKFKASNRQR